MFFSAVQLNKFFFHLYQLIPHNNIVVSVIIVFILMRK